MIRLLAVSAATFLALATTVTSGARAGCDEDCAYEAHEAAYERAYERESVREEAAEEGYYSSGGRSSSKSSSRSERAARGAQMRKATTSSAERQIAEPKPDPAPPRIPRSKVATENSSISTGSGSDRIAEDDTYERPAKAVGCKKYVASAGVTLSVPCE
ncbi:MAG TPA: hypothetical protein VIG38_10190 [Hyphomicrobium sp.]|jgi:hypothetical protein